jgi:hypothetical protein
MPRALRSGASRVVTCIEANEMGFDFVNTCSRCDYYMQNRAFNAKALKLPRLELSSMGQCTGNHILGDLCHHQSQKTPYRATKINSYNSYITSKSSVRASNNNSGSGKRLRVVFDHNTPQLAEQNTPSSAPSLPLMSSVEASRLSVRSTPLFAPSVPLMTSVETALSECYQCQRERDEVRAEVLNVTQQLQLREQEKSEAEEVASALWSEVLDRPWRNSQSEDLPMLLLCRHISYISDTTAKRKMLPW